MVKIMLVEWHLLTSNDNHVDSDPLNLLYKLDHDSVHANQTVRATAYFTNSHGSTFTGEIPVDVTFILPLWVKSISNGKTMNSAYLDFVAYKEGKLDISANLNGKLVTKDLTVLDSVPTDNGLVNGGSEIGNDAILSIISNFKSAVGSNIFLKFLVQAS